MDCLRSLSQPRLTLTHKVTAAMATCLCDTPTFILVGFPATCCLAFGHLLLRFYSTACNSDCWPAEGAPRLSHCGNEPENMNIGQMSVGSMCSWASMCFCHSGYKCFSCCLLFVFLLLFFLPIFFVFTKFPVCAARSLGPIENNYIVAVFNYIN